MDAVRSIVCLPALLVGLLVAGCQASVGGHVQAGASSSGASASGQARVAGGGGAHRRQLHPHLFYNHQTGALESDQFVEFDYNDARLRPESFEVLRALRDQLKRDRKVQVRIEGHTDSRGTPAYNKGLSERRAEAIRQWLIAEGIDGSRLTAVGLGEQSAPQYETRKDCYNATPRDASGCEAEWKRSRQAVYVVTAGAESLTIADGSSAGVDGGYGMAGCGLGAVLIHDHARGPQIIAATSNATSASQTFGITSMTSRCTSGQRAEAARAFIEANREALARDIARGKGEALANLASVAGCHDPDALGASLHGRFGEFFPDASASTDGVSDRLVATLREPAARCSLASPE